MCVSFKRKAVSMFLLLRTIHVCWRDFNKQRVTKANSFLLGIDVYLIFCVLLIAFSSYV